MHRVLCFGGRDFADKGRIDAALSLLPSVLGDGFAIIHGNARGADRLCGEWGKARGLCVITVDAPWEHYGKAAGSIRNGWMLSHCSPTYAVGFPGGTGTQDMARKLHEAGVTVWRP